MSTQCSLINIQYDALEVVLYDNYQAQLLAYDELCRFAEKKIEGDQSVLQAFLESAVAILLWPLTIIYRILITKFDIV